MAGAQSVVDIIEGVLRVGDIDTADDYYDVGGTSLQAVRICVQIKKELGVDIAPEALFDCDSIAAFADEVIALHDAQPTNAAG